MLPLNGLCSSLSPACLQPFSSLAPAPTAPLTRSVPTIATQVDAEYALSCPIFVALALATKAFLDRRSGQFKRFWVEHGGGLVTEPTEHYQPVAALRVAVVGFRHLPEMLAPPAPGGDGDGDGGRGSPAGKGRHPLRGEEDGKEGKDGMEREGEGPGAARRRARVPFVRLAYLPMSEDELKLSPSDDEEQARGARGLGGDTREGRDGAGGTGHGENADTTAAAAPAAAAEGDEDDDDEGGGGDHPASGADEKGGAAPSSSRPAPTKGRLNLAARRELLMGCIGLHTPHAVASDAPGASAAAAASASGFSQFMASLSLARTDAQVRQHPHTGPRHTGKAPGKRTPSATRVHSYS